MVFREGSGMVFQMQLARHRHAVPQTRDYMGEMERNLRARDELIASARAA
jgi:hypothetical protein